MTSMFCKQLPKIELHAHLNGSLSEETLKKLGCVEGKIIEYQKLNNILIKNERTLDECFQIFNVAHNLTNNKDAVYLATESVIQDFFNDNVIYLELRTTPRSEECMSIEEYIEAVIRAISDNKNDIIVKLLLSIDRKNDLRKSDETMDVIIKMKNKYPDIIKGVDLSGNPNIGSFNESLFEKARKNGIKTAIHCAEVVNNAEVNEILKFGPDRLGHSTFLNPNYGGSEDNWNLYKTLNIPTECCLTSNVVCGTSESYTKHHIREWISNNLPFCLSTDDKGVFCTTLSEEFGRAQKSFNLNENDLWAISRKTIEYCFASSDEKDYLRKTLDNWKLDNKNYFSF